MEQSAQPPRPTLHCLRGGQIPPDIATDLAAVKRLAEPARRKLYRVLGPCLVEHVPKLDAVLNEFCREFQVTAQDVVLAIQGCRFLLRQAAMTSLTVAEFAEDLATLGDTGEIRESLLSGYEMAMKMVRAEIVRGIVGDHGKILERVSWRVDQVPLSDRGDKPDLALVTLTLNFSEGSRRDRITLQMGMDQLRDLRAMCDRLL
jgi:hypothetical protein